MTTKDQNTLRDRLESDLQETLAEIEGMHQEVDALTRDTDDEGGTPRNHMADEGSSDYERERLISLQRELDERVQLIRDAQARLADGTYGTCLRCGKQITAERLEVMPFAAYDVECQQIIEEQGDMTGVKENEPLTTVPPNV
jgi:DnaK suppressor protein